MFEPEQQDLALQFAKTLADRDYAKAYTMLSQSARSKMAIDEMHKAFEEMIPLDWGEISPIEVFQEPAWQDLFVYVVIGGPDYSEAIIVNEFVKEEGETKIHDLEFGRP